MRTIPALLIWDEQASDLNIASLTLLDRLAVAVHRGGAGPITIVAPGRMPALERSESLGIPLEFATVAPVFEGPALMARGTVLVQAGDVGRLIEQGGRLVSLEGEPLPIGLLPSGKSLDNLDGLERLIACGVARLVIDAASALEAEKALWASLTSAADGMVDKWFNRPFGRVLSRLLVHTRISPNVVSLFSMAIGLGSAAFFAEGRYGAEVLAAILFQISAIVDCVDGDIARVAFKESLLGKWLDLVADQVVHLAVFAAIAIGMMRSEPSPLALWLGISAVAGAALSFAVVVRGMGRSADRNPLLQKLIASATNRDFSVLILVLACLNRVEWFLWMSAIGTHLFWMTALALQIGARPVEKPAR